MAEANAYWLLLFTVLIPSIGNAHPEYHDRDELHRTKRQSNSDEEQRYKLSVSIDDLIQSALSLVRPIIDTSRPLVRPVDDTTINKKMPERDRVILGETRYNSLDDVPICKGNSRICKFISCTAHNFKNDQSIANLNLAAQVLADTKLRKAISKDPDALSAVCHEQRLSGSQCKLFQKGFQLIDKFITSIEPVESLPTKTTQSVQDDELYPEEQDAPPVPIRPVIEAGSGMADDDPEPPIDPEPPVRGSHTWSSHPEPLEAIPDPPQSTPMTLATFPPLIFTFPTFPTVPPILPLIPASNKPPLSLFNFDNHMFKQHQFMGISTAKLVHPKLLRMIRSVKDGVERLVDVDFDDSDGREVRRKRESDYYDELEQQTQTTQTQKPGHTDSLDEYYGTGGPLGDEDQRRPSLGTKKVQTDGHINCFLLLQ